MPFTKNQRFQRRNLATHHSTFLRPANIGLVIDSRDLMQEDLV